MADVYEIIDHYFNLYMDKNRCCCHSGQIIRFQPSHIELLHLHDDIPKAQFLLAYHHSIEKGNDSDEKAKKYIDLSIRNGIGLAHNIRGCLADLTVDQSIECFEEAILYGSIRAYSNLGINYFHKKNEELSRKYFEMGIKENITCCKFSYLLCFEKERECYLEEVSKCAEKGCRAALNTMFCREKDKKKKRYWAELGMKKGFDTYIYNLINYYENHNKFKFWRLLREYQNSNDVNILLYVSKKYLKWNVIPECLSAIFKGMKLGHYECYDFARNNLDIIFDDPKQYEILANFLEKHKKDTIDELNLTVAYDLSGKLDKAKEILDKIEDEYHQNLGYFKYYHYMNNLKKSLEHLEKAYEFNKERFNSYADLGSLCLKEGQEEKGLKILEEGISLSHYNCYMALGDHYLRGRHYYEACQSLIQPAKKHWILANHMLETIIDQNPTIEIGKLLIENKRSPMLVT